MKVAKNLVHDSDIKDRSMKMDISLTETIQTLPKEKLVQILQKIPEHFPFFLWTLRQQFRENRRKLRAQSREEYD
jgi:hypothetical protein